MRYRELLRKFFILFIFSIAMGFMESAIVVYLRKIYYPDGFRFPLVPIDQDLAVVELLREAATIIMLITIGLISGKTVIQRFSFFIFCFGVWDIFYYVFLKMLIGWPAGLLDWDILFLIPVPWVGPVVAPCLLSMTMILLAIFICVSEIRDCQFRISPIHWLLLVTGSIIVISSFTIDYFTFIHELKNQNGLLENGSLLSELQKFIPEKFQWWIFLAGESLFLLCLALLLNKRYPKQINLYESA